MNPVRRAASSAGILMYRVAASKLEVLLVHPGGPYWRRKDDGAWSIPKGEMDADEDAAAAAIREFMEETGVAFTFRDRPGAIVLAAPVRSARMHQEDFQFRTDAPVH